MISYFTQKKYHTQMDN